MLAKECRPDRCSLGLGYQPQPQATPERGGTTHARSEVPSVRENARTCDLVGPRQGEVDAARRPVTYDVGHAQNCNALAQQLAGRACRWHWPGGIGMLRLLSRIPAEQRKGVASGALTVATFGALFGLVMLGAFSEATEEECTGHLVWKKCVDVARPMSARITELAGGIGLLAVALASVVVALLVVAGPRDAADTQAHLQRYVAILHGHESMSVLEIASVTGAKAAKVRAEIQAMIDSRMISEYYIDYGRDLVVSKKYVPPTGNKTVVQCPHCKANTELIVGIPKPCSYCRKPLILGAS